jgi:hypothetical protein
MKSDHEAAVAMLSEHSCLGGVCKEKGFRLLTDRVTYDVCECGLKNSYTAHSWEELLTMGY